MGYKADGLFLKNYGLKDDMSHQKDLNQRDGSQK